jgi:hypothetical protein
VLKQIAARHGGILLDVRNPHVSGSNKIKKRLKLLGVFVIIAMLVMSPGSKSRGKPRIRCVVMKRIPLPLEIDCP